MNRCTRVALCLILATSAFAAEPTTYDEVLESIQDSAALIETWSADGDITMNMGGMAMSFKMSMKGKGERLVANMDMNMMGQQMKMHTVMDKDHIQWTDMDMMGQRQIMKMDMDVMMEMGEEISGISASQFGGSPFGGNQNPVEMLEMYSNMYELKYVGMDTVGETSVFKLSGTIKDEFKDTLDPTGRMKQMGMSMDTSVMYIGADDGFMRKMEMLNPQGTPFMTMTYKNVLINQPIPDSEFVFTPPEGITVMDMTEMMKTNMENLQSGQLPSAPADNN